MSKLCSAFAVYVAAVVVANDDYGAVRVCVIFQRKYRKIWLIKSRQWKAPSDPVADLS